MIQRKSRLKTRLRRSVTWLRFATRRRIGNRLEGGFHLDKSRIVSAVHKVDVDDGANDIVGRFLK